MLLAAHALGELPAVSSLFVACHLTFCAACRGDVHRHEQAAGALLAEAAAAPLPPELLARVLSRAELSPPEVPAQEPSPLASLAGFSLPRPLGRWLAGQGVGPATSLRAMSPGVRSLRLESPEASNAFAKTASAEAPRGRLLLFRAGLALPRHRHRGDEHTLVLAGGFSDRDQRYAVGDVACARADEAHAPRVDDDGPCLVLLLDHGPIVGMSAPQRLLLSLIDG